MNVPEETKQKYLDSSVDKQLLITFPDLNEGQGLNISMEQILFETMSLKESILENSSIEFVGCVASEFSISLYGVREDLKGQRIIVNIQAGNTTPIRLFYGIVDSVEMEANHDKRKITAYDMLYTVGNFEVAKWYTDLPFPKNGMTLKDIRTRLFAYINAKLEEKYQDTGFGLKGVVEQSIVLPCDGIKIKRRYKPSTLQSIAVIKALCQINGVFGMMSRIDNNGKCQFEYRIITQTATKEGAFPGATLYPDFLPGYQYTGDKPSQYVPYYRSVDYQEFTVKPVDSITIRQSDTDEGYTYPDNEDGNTYIIQGNMFTYKLPKKDLLTIASNIFPNISNFSYQPFEGESNGLPWLECGIDGISYYTYDYNRQEYVTKNFSIFSREITGLQSLKDNYSAEGEQDQRMFISDVHSQIDVINQKIEDVEVDLTDYYNKEEINEMFEQFDPGTTGWSVESVSQLPPQGQPNVLYLIQGEVVVN